MGYVSGLGTIDTFTMNCSTQNTSNTACYLKNHNVKYFCKAIFQSEFMIYASSNNLLKNRIDKKKECEMSKL